MDNATKLYWTWHWHNKKLLELGISCKFHFQPLRFFTFMSWIWVSLTVLKNQKKYVTKNKQDLVETMTMVFDNLNVEILDNVFVTLMSVMNESILNNGGNNYDIPHYKKNWKNKNNTSLKIECIKYDDTVESSNFKKQIEYESEFEEE